MNCLDYFKQLCSVPHGSGNTKQVSDLLFSFCKEHGCECVQDELGNIVAYKAGSEGRENEEPVILQAHMDMVCVADEGVEKDFINEPIVLKEDGKFIWADGTSLGADDGIGVAMIMAVLAEESMSSHPPITAVITVGEETGMTGAFGLDAALIKGKRMINLDHGEGGAITVGCAGGRQLQIDMPCMWETLNEREECYALRVSGLKGGHSGCEIADHRANSIRLLARILYGLGLKTDIKLCEFDGGSANNVIPSEAYAVAAVPVESAELFVRLAGKHEILFRHEYPNETGITLEIAKCPKAVQAVTALQTKKMMRFLGSAPDGMRKMCEDFPKIAQTSSNMGTAGLYAKGLSIEILARSSVQEELDELTDMIIKIAEHEGGVVHDKGGYPVWEYRKDSPLRNAVVKTYKEMTGAEPQIEATHGGLETGIFNSRIDDFDCVAMGPTMTGIHSAAEKLDIASTIETYAWLTAVLARI